MTRHTALATTVALLAGSMLAQPSGAADVTPQRLVNADREPQNWLMNHRTYSGQRFSPLARINKDNVKNLQVVWRWKADNFGPRPEFNNEATPLMIGGALYTTVGVRRDIVAIDAATGETLWLWRYDEGPRGQAAPRLNHRGVAYWSDGGGDERILYVTPGYHLIALSAKNIGNQARNRSTAAQRNRALRAINSLKIVSRRSA